MFMTRSLFELNPKYQEIIKLHNMLEEANIPHTFDRDFDGWQICYPITRPNDECVMDAIEKRGSYGAENDLLEIMGLLTPEELKHDSVVGYLTADDVFQRIKNHYEKHSPIKIPDGVSLINGHIDYAE